jgi:hypothetical protein
MSERERPSKHGAILGDALALLAMAGRRDAPMAIPDGCLTCAFRPGTMPNQMAATGKIALYIVLGLDKDRFACHHGMKDGEPKKICVGYVAARLAPWSLTLEVISTLKKELDGMDKSADEVRADFDRWINKLDPDRKMDDYAIARAFAKREPATAIS